MPRHSTRITSSRARWRDTSHADGNTTEHSECTTQAKKLHTTSAHPRPNSIACKWEQGRRDNARASNNGCLLLPRCRLLHPLHHPQRQLYQEQAARLL